MTDINLLKKPLNYNLWLLAVLIITITVQTSGRENIEYALSYIALFIAAEILVRIFQYLENNYAYRGKNKCNSTLIKDMFNFDSKTLVFCGIAIFSYFLLSNVIVLYKLAVITAFIFTRASDLGNSKYVKKLWIENSEGLDYGSGMAFSFFYGYLNIILPDKGDKNQSIKEIMTIYEGQHNIKIPEYKLFLLINKNLFTTPNLSDMSKKSVKLEACSSMLEVKRNRAGIRDRSYKNTVYKLYKEGREAPYFVVSEGATPLLTLYEALKSSGEYHNAHEKHIDEIVCQFYRTLKKLIDENFDCKDVCELLYFDSETTDVGELLWNRLENGPN